MSTFKILAVSWIFISVTLFAQYNPDNHVVTFTKNYLNYLQDVEGGTAEERNKLFEEESQKMDGENKLMISKLVLGHRWTGSINEVVQMAEWKSIADADKSVLGTADRRKAVWPDEEERKAFFDKRNKYIAPGHKDIAVHTNWVKLSKR